MKKLVSIVTGCFNEEENVQPLYERICAAMEQATQVDFELIYIDNSSSDQTAARVRELCARDARVRLIVNARNFGHIRSPYHAVMQARGAAVVYLASDLQDPPELLPAFISAWENGASVAAGVYNTPPDSGLIGLCRSAYYKIINGLSEARPIPSFTGFGLYDRRVVELLRQTGGPYPYVRGLVSEFGLPITTIPFDKERRRRGVTKNNVLTLIDQSILGLVSMSRAPVRFATLLGAAMSVFGFVVAGFYLVAKLMFWNSFPVGQAPLLIGIFLFGSIQILVAGLIGEYIGSLHQRAQNMPHVVELYRVNFNELSDDRAAPGSLGENLAP